MSSYTNPVWFGHMCSGQYMSSTHERFHGLGTDALAIGGDSTQAIFWFRKGLVTVCMWNTIFHILGMVTVCTLNTMF